MNKFRKAQSLFPFLVFMIVFCSARISVDQRRATFTDYVEGLSKDLGISKDENILFIFDKEFLRRNDRVDDQYRIQFTSQFDTSAIVIKNTFKLHLAFLKFPTKDKVIYAFNVLDEDGFRMAYNTQDLLVNTTKMIDLYDTSWLLEQWKEQRSLGKVKVEFNVANTTRKEFNTFEEWRKYGPVFLVAYFKSISTTFTRSFFAGNRLNRRYGKLRSGRFPTECRLHSFRTSFARLGLSKVYVRPKGLINFSLCYGRCDVANSMSSFSKYITPHAFILELAKRRHVFSFPAVRANLLKSKCVPTKYQGLGVLKRESNGNLVRKTIFDLTASACGCR